MRAESFDPFSDAVLSKYLENVLEWHGYIRFLGLPHLRQNPDITIDRLYVEPNIAERWLSPDSPPSEWSATVPAVEALGRHQRLVLLGDPGSGKSTLVNWVACQLALTSPGPLVHAVGRLLPLPMVVRELPVTRATSWDRLLDAFLQRPVARPLGDRSTVDHLLTRGQVLVVLDGLDELGAHEVRTQLRAAVREGMRRYPACRWLFTSRIVGYDDVPFHVEEDEGIRPRARAESQEPERTRLADVRYVAPFDDDQIRRFAANWFAQREAVVEKAQTDARAFVDAMSRDRATLRLARTPNLLTMMALIFRNRARLPHGRALLYNEITEAYLESIDQFRKLTSGTEYPEGQKRRWLSRVGFEMQRRRSVEGDAGDGGGQEILVDEADVRHWIAEAMGESGYGSDDKAAGEFVDHIARRSGLLLPRGEGKFAFMHLSFQEYFAARFLEEQITAPEWLTSEDEEAAPGARRAEVVEHARQATWRETFIFLFELLAERPRWPQRLANIIFWKAPDALGRDASGSAVAALLAQLTVNPHSGFTSLMRDEAMDACWRREVDVQRAANFLSGYRPVVARILFSAEPDQNAAVWRSLIKVAHDTDRLTLLGAPITIVDELAKLTNLQELELSETPVSDIGPLIALRKLRSLFLARTAIRDFGALSRLSRLGHLDLAGTRIANLQPLTAHPDLLSLELGETSIADIGLLATFKDLESLYLYDTPVSDLTPLADLTKVRYLLIDRTQVTSLVHLAGLTRLNILSASNTGVSDLRPLSGLLELEWLMLSGTPVADLTPLAGLTSLRTLALHDTKVTDVSPLVHMTGLRKLYLGGTRVTDLGSLANRPELKIFR